MCLLSARTSRAAPRRPTLTSGTRPHPIDPHDSLVAKAFASRLARRQANAIVGEMRGFRAEQDTVRAGLGSLRDGQSRSGVPTAVVLRPPGLNSCTP
jgi:hypothetical protein